MTMDYETRQKIKKAIDENKRKAVKRSGLAVGTRLNTLTRKERDKQLHYKECIRGCGRKAWHPPKGTGRCLTCAVIESVATRKPRTKKPDK